MRTRIFYTIVILLLISGTTFARGFTGIGAKGGLSMTGVTGKTIDVPNSYIRNTDKDWLMRGTGGFFALYSLNRDIYFQGDLLYTMKGGEATHVYSDSGVSHKEMYNYQFDYIELPIVIKYVLEQEESFKPSIFTGPQFGYMVNDLIKIDSSHSPVKEYTLKNVNKFDFSWVFGIDANIPLETGRMMLDVRYFLPFTNFVTKPAVNDSTSGRSFLLSNKEDLGRNTGVQAQTHGLTFMLGYVFDLPKRP